MVAVAAVVACTAGAAAERPPLPLRPDGYGVAQPTPPDLVDRRLPTRDILPPPADGTFTSAVGPVPDDVLARSTWKPECPVPPADLRYVTVSFRGFDGLPHTGELIVAARVADDVAAVFGELYAAGFPIEEMRVVEPAELTAPPTGDDNNTTAFVCRPAVGSTRWSAHALGLAVDVNPFQNPYSKGDLVLPELATAYLDRDRDLPGMISGGGPVVAAFERIGWKWGGRWTSPVDRHHFSQTGT
ncbi:M15 family metallopeptidase [Pseudonocardia sp. DSM 110487]|uniref:M15 family metallopeptidase n=1 Tax=Pseudonocardia sp. DSM 110487 TaxID=2865833 RepID=UPI002105C234|nr:M15 family metallopeptidase [Pseudonocardia sp. DSM 110487]